MKLNIEKIVIYSRGMATMLLIASLALNFYMFKVTKLDPVAIKMASMSDMRDLVK